jgi:uncharacterized protein (DUF1499 family)
MPWLDGLTKNRAELRDDAADPRLRSIVVSRSPLEAAVWAGAVIATLPRWSVVAVDQGACTLNATRATRVWRFIDDIHVSFGPDPNGSRITAHSQSRVGRGDFGQNARNLRELARALEANR